MCWQQFFLHAAKSFVGDKNFHLQELVKTLLSM